MSIVNRKIALSLVTLALVAAPLGCAAPSDASDEPVTSETADFSASSLLADAHQQGPTLDQVVTVLTKVLDLSEGQVKKLRAFLQAQEDAYHRAHP